MALPSSSAYGSLRSTCFPVGFFESPTFYSWILGRLGAQKVWMSTCSWVPCLGLAWGSLFKLAPGANTQLHWVNAWTHQHFPDASIEGFCQGDMFYQTIWRIPTSCCYKCAKPLNTWLLGWCFRSPWHLALGAPISAPFSVPCPPEDRSRVSCHSAIWMPNTWKRLATPKLRQQTISKSQRERWKMLKTLKGSCWCPFYIFFQRISPKKNMVNMFQYVPIQVTSQDSSPQISAVRRCWWGLQPS
jgi:hypothetical protein